MTSALYAAASCTVASVRSHICAFDDCEEENTRRIADYEDPIDCSF